MKMIHLFKLSLLLLVLHNVRCSDSITERLLHSIENNVSNPTLNQSSTEDTTIKPTLNISKEENEKEGKFIPVLNITSITPNRTEDYCSYTKIQIKKEQLPDPEECERINNIFKDDENYNDISYDGSLFESLKKGIDSLVFPAEKMNTIFFVGNTGSGKTTLVQILGADNTQIYSRPVHENANEFIIADDSKIGTDTVTSQTLYPELLVDYETGFILCDNPGFRDTRSPVHEIVAAYSMREVLRHTKKIKIVIVTTHTSLRIGMYRDDFTNLLKHSCDLFSDIDKYKNAFYLIGSKAENNVIFQKNKPVILSDFNMINNIGHFLIDIKTSLSNENNTYNITEKAAFFKKATKILDSLLEKTNGKIYNRINIMRRPMEEGKLSEIELLQNERKSIRNMLLNDDNLVDINVDDFGFALTKSAILYLDNLFKKMNSYITNFSKIICRYIKSYYQSLIDSNTDINYISSMLISMKKDLKTLSIEIGVSKDPGQYVDVISNFSKKHKLQLDCLTILHNITELNEYMIHLEDLSTNSTYTPLSWNTTMKILSDYIDNKIEEYNFLKESFNILSDIKFQKKRRIFNFELEQKNESFKSENELLINDRNFKIFLEKTNLNAHYSQIEPDSGTLEKLNTIVNIMLKHKYNFICEKETVVLLDYFVLLSELDEEKFISCKNNKKIVILAMHTIFIDKDLTGEWLSGKELTIIAPVWEVFGSINISVDGKSGGEPLPKATLGQIGKNGKNGKSGGKFVGIGMRFNNGENLIISASGGNGQDGQEGGDGEEGKRGINGNKNLATYKDGHTDIYLIVNFHTSSYIHKGSSGETGGDSGAGGRGGRGGYKGSVTIYSIENEDHNISIVTKDGSHGSNGKDGIPGKGAVKGCDKVIEEKTSYFLFVPFSSKTEIKDTNCDIKSDDGSVRRQGTVEEHNDTDIINNDSPVCIHIMNFEKYYLKEYHTLLTDGIPMKFINKMKMTKY